MVDYQEYILSEAWAFMRRARLIEDKYKCCRCGFKRELQVHHKTYDRLGNEEMEDLETLCVRCHNDIHMEGRQVFLTQRQIAQATEVTEEEYRNKVALVIEMTANDKRKGATQ